MVSAGIGLKEPSLEQSFGGNFRVQGNPDLKPERSRTFDAGIVQSIWSDRLFIEATVFHYMYQDQIALGNPEVPTFTSVFGDLTMEERQRIREEIRAGLRERPQLDRRHGSLRG